MHVRGSRVGRVPYGCVRGGMGNGCIWGLVTGPYWLLGSDYGSWVLITGIWP